MLHLVRRSLLFQLLGAYLLFVIAILAADLKVNDVAQQQVTAQVQTTDLALAQEISRETENKIRGAESTLVTLSRLDAVRQTRLGAMTDAFRTFRAARRPVSPGWRGRLHYLQCRRHTGARCARSLWTGVGCSGDEFTPQ